GQPCRGRRHVRARDQLRRGLRARNPAAAAGKLCAFRADGPGRTLPARCADALPRRVAGIGIGQHLRAAQRQTRGHRFPDFATAPAAFGARHDGVDRRDHGAYLRRGSPGFPDPARSYPQAARRPGHVSLQPLRLWRQGTSLAMPELQAVGQRSPHPRCGERVMTVLAAAVVACGVAFALSALLAWAAIAYAHRRGMLDQPGFRRSHHAPTPRGGGVGLVAGTLLAATMALGAWPGGGNPWVVAAWGIAATAVAAIGWIDDHRALSVLPRLLTQLLAAIVFAAAVIHVRHMAWAWLPLWVLLAVWSIN